MNRRLVAAMERRNAIVDRQDELNEASHNADREFTDDESKEYESLETEFKSVEATITRETALEARMKLRSPMQRNRSPQEERETEEKTPKFKTFGEFLGATVAAANPSHRVIDPRLNVGAYGSGMNEQNAESGGFLLQPELATEILRLSFQTGIFTKLVRNRKIGPNANQLKINALKDYDRRSGARYGGIQTYWLEEGAQKVPSAPKFRQMVLTLKKLIGLFYATDELLQDAVALEQIAKDAFTEEFGFILDDVILWGSGAGQPFGMLNSPARVVVAAEGGQTAATINFKNIIKMYAAFWTRSKLSPAARWLSTPQVMPQLMQMTLGGTTTVFGAPVFLPPNAAEGRPIATLMGIPIVENEHSKPLGTEGDIALADFDQYLLIDKAGTSPDAPRMDSSIHVRFIWDETTFRMVYRCDGQLMWEKPLTQANDTANQMSPVVTLAAR